MIYPEKRRAWAIFKLAIKHKILSPMLCEVCGKSKTQGHHEDYSEPLIVNWLCPKHHSEFDKIRRKNVKENPKLEITQLRKVIKDMESRRQYSLPGVRGIIYPRHPRREKSTLVQ